MQRRLHRHASRGLVGVCLLALFLIVPARLSADAPADADGKKSLARGIIRFTPPDGWTDRSPNNNDIDAIYVWPEHGSSLAFQVLPPDAAIDAKAVDAILRKQRQYLDSRHAQVITPPTVQAEPGFQLHVYEKFKIGDDTTEQHHYYRQVGGRIVMVTVKATNESDDDAKAAVAMAVRTAKSAEWRRAK